MKNKKILVYIIGALTAVIAIAAVVFVILDQQSKPAITSDLESGIERETIASSSEITYEGKTYTYNKNIQTVLFMGIDKKDAIEKQDYVGDGGQSDCLLLIVMDKSTKEATVLTISRDSMVDVDIYDQGGNLFSTAKEQIALQYAYGDGKKKSCWLTKKAVAKLMGDIPINAYLALSIDGISTINDLIGGVTLTIPKDYTDIDEAFVEGATVTLKGSQAEAYVRKRDITVLGSNNGRMERQNQYIMAMINQMKSKGAGNSAFYQTLVSDANPYLVTDMTVDQMQEMTQYSISGEIIKVPGETVEGEKHDEYIIDEAALQELIIKTFYIQKN